MIITKVKQPFALVPLATLLLASEVDVDELFIKTKVLRLLAIERLSERKNFDCQRVGWKFLSVSTISIDFPSSFFARFKTACKNVFVQLG